MKEDMDIKRYTIIIYLVQKLKFEYQVMSWVLWDNEC